jgi:arabinogalactan endo-1,4-beta-galactosidase
MKIQADITTYLLNTSHERSFYINQKEAGLEDILKEADIDTVRISFFSDESPILPVDASIHLLNTLKNDDRSFYLCLQCSDTWADPSHQWPPGAWEFSGKKSLMEVFLGYISSILEKVKATGCNVSYIQVGNEISNGLLWPHLAKPYDYVNFIKPAHRLCRQYFPGARLVLHTDLSYSGEKALEWYGFMEKRKVDWDLAGLSYYPVWHGGLEQLSDSIRAIFSVTSRKIILSEMGYMNTTEKTSAWFGDWKCGDIAYSPEGQRNYLSRFRQFCGEHREFLQDEMFWWGMFSSGDPVHFPIALFGRDGNALPALFELNKDPRSR